MKNQGVLYLMQIFSGYYTDWMSKTGHFGQFSFSGYWIIKLTLLISNG